MKNSKGYKLFNFIMKIVSWCIMAILCLIGGFLIVYIAINKIAQSQGKNAPLGLYTIISPSMTPGISVYDVVFVVYKDPKDIEIGDIISYRSTNKAVFDDIPITHRVVEKFNTNSGISFRTKGDANPVVDNEIIMQNNVIGTVRFVIPALGRIQFFLASKGGWFIAILLPALGIIIYDVIKLVKLMSVKNKMKYAEELEDSETPKKEIKPQVKTRSEKYNRFETRKPKEEKFDELIDTLNKKEDSYKTIPKPYEENEKTSKRK